MRTDLVSTMRNPGTRPFSAPRRPGRVAAALLCTALALAACSRPPPRSFDFFLSDEIARDGAIARCDAHPAEAQRDIECANARRAATTLALREEQGKRQALERESENKLEALRRRLEAQRAVERPAAEVGGEGAQAPEAPAASEQAFGAPLQAPVVGVPPADAPAEAAPAEGSSEVAPSEAAPTEGSSKAAPSEAASIPEAGGLGAAPPADAGLAPSQEPLLAPPQGLPPAPSQEPSSPGTAASGPAVVSPGAVSAEAAPIPTPSEASSSGELPVAADGSR